MADRNLLRDIIDSWHRNNRITVNLLGLVPDSAMDRRVTEGSPTIAQMFMHMHYCRLVFVEEDVPEVARPVPQGEWTVERDRTRLVRMLNDSADAVVDAVQARLASGKPMDRHYDHPILLFQHMIWHEGYHHGQIKLALKIAGLALEDEVAGDVTWDVWMGKSI